MQVCKTSETKQQNDKPEERKSAPKENTLQPRYNAHDGSQAKKAL